MNNFRNRFRNRFRNFRNRFRMHGSTGQYVGPAWAGRRIAAPEHGVLYRVRAEYLDAWSGGNLDYDAALDADEIQRLAIEWGRPVSELMREVERV